MQEKTQLDPITTLSAMLGALNSKILEQQKEIAELQETIVRIRKWATEVNKQLPKKRRRGGDNGARKGVKVTNDQLQSVFSLIAKHCGVNYAVLNPSGERTPAAKMLASRLKEGYTVEQAKGVVGQKWMQWGEDDKMRQYFRPQTLFQPSKFSGYVASVGRV